jgi:predicted DNA binding CopG/RHH family protein
MKTKNPIKPNGSDQDRTVSGHIAKSTRTSITIKFPKAYINEYRQGKMVERMSTANHTSQNAMDANYAGQVQENFDQIIKSEKTNITIKLPSAYIEKVRQGIVVDGIPHKDKSQSASKESAYSHDSNALGLDKTVACMAKASTTEIKRHENVSTSPTTRGPSSGFSLVKNALIAQRRHRKSVSSSTRP